MCRKNVNNIKFVAVSDVLFQVLNATKLVSPIVRCTIKYMYIRMYRVRQIKVIPCRVLLISQQRIGIFTRKFTRLFAVHIYV